MSTRVHSDDAEKLVVIGPRVRRVFEKVWSEALAKRAGVKPTAIQRMLARGWTFHNGAA